MIRGNLLLLCTVLSLLVGCAEPPAEKPMANGAYLVIDGREAWAVLVANGKRIEEHGTVRDAIRLPRSRSMVAASYVIDTPNCGRLQWLTEGEGSNAGTTLLLPEQSNASDLSQCQIRTGMSRVWTALDYSS
ncbi:hypothetical protein [Pseudomonas knackmussii]|uniref:hypothetical protein n=1 Tax=Pseudomonas knackmussii TaxID=65741 RepID=UPI003F4A33E3